LAGLAFLGGKTYGGPALPNRRAMELTIVTVILLHPVIRMAHIWAAKHLQTSDNPSTGTAAEVVLQVL